MSKRKGKPKHGSGRRSKAHSITEQVLSRESSDVHRELDYILQRAEQGDGRVVGFQQLVFFSTSTGDAWMLDWEDELTMCLMEDGVPQR